MKYEKPEISQKVKLEGELNGRKWGSPMFLDNWDS